MNVGFSVRLAKLPFLLGIPAASILLAGKADAILTYTIFESGSNVVVQTTGSLSTLGSQPPIGGYCGGDGLLQPSLGIVCAGPDELLAFYPIIGPSSFEGTANVFADSSTGLSSGLFGDFGLFGILPTYTLDSEIASTSTFNNATLASLGFTTFGLLGTWTIGNGSNTDSIKVVIVPAPLPLLGAAAAFGWSRRLRRRVFSSKANKET
jgi:hypothetical protein